MTRHTQTPTTTFTPERTRPRWATTIRHVGEDLSWACRGWTGFPPAFVRSSTAIGVAITGWIMDAPSVISRIFNTFGA